jgi:hypothetical protein
MPHKPRSGFYRFRDIYIYIYIYIYTYVWSITHMQWNAADVLLYVKSPTAGVACLVSAGQSGDQFPAEARDVSVFRNVQTECGDQPLLLFNGYRELFPWR